MQNYPHSLPENQAIARCKAWVETIVVGLDLCPFAAPDVRNLRLHYALSEAQTQTEAVQDFLTELERIQLAAPHEIATSLLIFNRTALDFFDYLDLLDLCQQALERAGLDGVFQLASFHPRYCFAGVDEDDISNWTNRSPLPMLHIIREGQMSRVLQHYPDAEQIPERNIERLRKLGREGLLRQFPELASYWPDAGNQTGG